jgi:hypothetical protein
MAHGVVVKHLAYSPSMETPVSDSAAPSARRRVLRTAAVAMAWVVPAAALVAVILACAVVFPRWLSPPPTSGDLQGLSQKERLDTIRDQHKLENDIRTALLGGLAGLGVLVGSAVGWQQLRHNRRQLVETIRVGQQQLDQGRQGQITERFTRAIEQLGSNKPEIVLGAIYALERIAGDAPDEFQGPIGEVLTTYIRMQAPWPPSLPGQYVADAPLDQVPWLQVRAPTVQASLTVLGRGAFNGVIRIDLTRTDLRHADLSGANLNAVELWDANLAAAEFEGATLDSADLRGAILHEAFLGGGIFVLADLRRADLRGAHLSAAILDGAKADPTTRWPEGFDWRAADVDFTDKPIAFPTSVDRS